MEIIVIFKLINPIDILSNSQEIALRKMPQNIWWEICIASGKGLVPSGNKPLPEPMLTQIYAIIWRHWATIV